MKRLSAGKKILLGIIGLTLVLCVTAFSYFNDYCHASSHALELIQETETIEHGENYLAFVPKDYDTGVILYPGAKVESEAYAPLLKELADRGIFAAVVYVPLHFALLDSDAAFKVMEEHPEVQNWYIGGHSLGGVAAGVLAGRYPERFQGIILLASYVTSDLSKTELKALTLIGSNDGVINREQYRKNRKNLPEETKEITIQGGNHAQFGSYGFQKGDNEADITREEQWELSAEYILKLVVE
ncbi:MAG: alpha/beta hydrolase [Erysipelotrichaceae bacterium]|nr:alpha/beta hydrolase [Erysipelotrichaceae bacterium]